MQLTKQTDFAFRILIYLAALPEGERTHIQALCDYFDISHNHVAKIVMKLTKTGFVQAYRGKGGGIALGKDPASITLGTVVSTFEPNMDPVKCNLPVCRLMPGCKLKKVLNNAMRQFQDTLESYTLADVMEQKIRINRE